jgi:fructose-1,6-bisphosphatase/inositol monophosphatase family enzyme
MDPIPVHAATACACRDVHRRIRDAATAAARAAGQVQLTYFGRSQTVDAIRPHDLKLVVDRLSEEAMLKVLTDAFPDHGIVSEERAAINAHAAFTWYLDPLDGSVNYFLGQPYFCACVACYHRPPSDSTERSDGLGRPVAGVVFAPVLGLMFEARAEGPALCNGAPIRPGGERRLKEAVIGVSFGSDEATMERMIPLTAQLASRSRKLRIFGATGLDLVSVAGGRLSGLVQGGVRIWDFAAAKVILEACGGYFRAEDAGDGRWRIVGAAPGIAEELQRTVDRHFTV